jgi:hypothetical protein
MEKVIEPVNKARIKELCGDAPSTGNVEIRLKDPKRTGTITVRGYTDAKGRYRPFVDQYGNERVKKFSRTVYLNMEETDDRLTLEQVRLHPLYINGPRPVLVIVNHESDADAYVALKDNEAKAMTVIQALEGDELKNFARVLLIKVKPGSSDKVIKRSIYDVAETNPGLVLNEWNDEQRELKVIIRKGIESGMFEVKHGRYTYQGQLMGATFEQAVDWLQDNDDLVPSMRKNLK